MKAKAHHRWANVPAIMALCVLPGLLSGCASAALPDVAVSETDETNELLTEPDDETIALLETDVQRASESAQEAQDNIYIEMSAQWLATEMGQGLTYDRTGAIDTADNVSALLALAALGHADEAKAIAIQLTDPEHLSAQTGTGSDLKITQTAQLVVALAALGLDPSNVGDRDLVIELTEAMDDNWGTSVHSGVAQGWAAIALAKADQSQWAGMVKLVGAQCEDGGFPQELEAEPGCISDVQATARVLSGLALTLGGSVTDHDGALATAREEAISFLNGAALKSVDGTVSWVDPQTQAPSLELTSAATVALTHAGHDVEGSAGYLFAQLASATNGGAVPRDGVPDVGATAQTLLALVGDWPAAH